jgi:hypothetical protein
MQAGAGWTYVPTARTLIGTVPLANSDVKKRGSFSVRRISTERAFWFGPDVGGE